MNVHDGEVSTSLTEQKRSWLKEVLLQPRRQREDNKTSAARMPDTVTLRANRPCLAPVHPDPDPSEASSDDEAGVHSESENERGALGSSSCEDVSDSKKARGIFDDWVAIQSSFAESQDASCHACGDTAKENIKSTAAALEAALITGFNEKTICGYRKEFFENHGTFRDESRRKYK